MIDNPHKLLRESHLNMPMTYSTTEIYTGGYEFTTLEYELFRSSGNDLVFIDELNFSTDIPEDLFVSAFYTIKPLQFKFKHLLTNEIFSAQPYKLNVFYKKFSLPQYFEISRKNDGIRLSLSGYLKQIPALIGVGTINCIFNVKMFQISDDKTIEAVKRGRV
jgi:hypothetical protein